MWAFSPNYVSFGLPAWNNLESYWCSGWDLIAPSVYPYLPDFWHTFDYQYNLLIHPFWEKHQVPVILGEWSAPEYYLKPEYYRETLESIKNYPEIKGVLIFAARYEYDWRPNSSESSLEAIRDALSSDYFIDGIELEWNY